MMSLDYNVKYGSDLHKKVVQAVRARYNMSKDKMQERYAAFAKAEDAALSYIPESEHDRVRKEAKRNKGALDYITVEVPYSYGMMMTQHTYLCAVFLARNPIMQFSGRHGEPEQSVMGVESLMSYQVDVGGHLVPYYLWLYDACKYGFGVIGHHWDEEIKRVAVIENVQETFLGQPIPGKFKKALIRKELPGYKGNRVFNVKPTKWFPDPRVPMSKFQEGEFVSWLSELSWTDIKSGQAQGRYINVDVLKKKLDSGAGYSDVDTGSPRMLLPESDTTTGNGMSGMSDLGDVEILQAIIKIIPRDWGLGEGEWPEKWCFTIANKDVLIECKPLGLYHDKFPFDIVEQEIESYSLFKRGTMEQLEPLNDIMTWLFNSHFYNVRAALNNMFIYDPSRITEKDLLDPGPGKRIRLRPDAYGTDVRGVVAQMAVGDVTQTHAQDAIQVSQMMQRAMGISENVMGMINPGGRRTATEVRSASSFSVNRVKTTAEYMSAMGFAPLSMKLLANTQQFYDGEMKLKIVGDTSTGKGFLDVTPETIAGAYDFVPVDGTFPVDRFAQANLWKEIMINMRNMPEIAQQYDLAGMFSWVAQLGGMRNINQFRVKMVPDEDIMGKLAAGNIAPLTPNIASLQPNLNEPRQIPNLGPTG